MAKAYDAKVDPKSDIAVNLSNTMTRRENMMHLPFTLTDFTQDANISRPPDYHIHVYNIAPRKFEIRRPPNFPCIVFRACPKDMDYIKVGIFPNIVNEKWVDADTGETRTRGIIGERFVMDLLNPTNLGVDMWHAVTDENMSWIDGGTDDMTRRGLFFSTDDPPKEEHLATTKRLMQEHYRKLIQQADEAFMSNDRDQRRSIGPEHHMAAEYFHAKSQWHVIAELPSICPNCGEATAPGIAYHRNSMGLVCVIDWRKAVNAGIVKADEVPDDMKWETAEAKR